MLAHDLAKKLLEGPNLHVVGEDNGDIFLPMGELAEEEVTRWKDCGDSGIHWERMMSKTEKYNEKDIRVLVISFLGEDAREW